MKLIVGLGNVGRKYDLTRHNVGFIVLDEYAHRNNLEFKYDKKLESLIIETFISGEKVVLAKPTTYVNLSGNALSKLVNYYKVDTDDILIIYDDISLETGRLRIRETNSHGGHNGVRDIIKHLKTKDIKRIRIGIDVDNSMPLDNYVLGRFSKKEQEILRESVLDSMDIIEMFAKGIYFKDIMTKYNSKYK